MVKPHWNLGNELVGSDSGSGFCAKNEKPTSGREVGRRLKFWVTSQLTALPARRSRMRREPALRLMSADLATATNVAGHAHIVWRLVVSLCCLEVVMVKSD